MKGGLALPTPSVQVPRPLQVSAWHASMSSAQVIPEYPALHVQATSEFAPVSAQVPVGKTVFSAPDPVTILQGVIEHDTG